MTAPGATWEAIASALVQASEAEWVLFLDSDEIALPRGGSLHDLDDLDEYDILAVPRYNVVLGPNGPHAPTEMTPDQYSEVLIYAQPIPDFYHHMRRHPRTPWIQGVLEPKTLARPRAIAAMHPGNHDIDATTTGHWRRAVARDLFLAHMPFRTLERFAMRSANYLAEIEADPAYFASWSAWQWRLFAEAHQEGRTGEEFDHQMVGAEELATLRSQLVVRSAAEVFADPITRASSDAAWMSMAARAEPWLTAASQVSRREDIQPGGKLEHVSGSGQYPAVLLPPKHVVRFYAPWRDGHEAARREADALRMLGPARDLHVPSLVASGELEPDLLYNVMTRMPGVELGRIDYELSHSDRDALASWVGGFVGRLHAVPLSQDDRARGWRRFEEVVRRRYEYVQQVAVRCGLPNAFVERIPGWLPSIDELMGAPSEAVFCHGALGASSLLGRPAQPTFSPTGVVDFSQAFVGHPLAELGAIWWDILTRDPAALETFLEASGLHRQVPDFARLALAWALMTPVTAVPDLGDVGHVEEPDDLAERWFGRFSS